MKVWLAWSGEYSDKCVIAVCSSEENAKAIAGTDRDGWHMTEPFELDQFLDKATQGLKAYAVQIYDDGRTFVRQSSTGEAESGDHGYWTPYSATVGGDPYYWAEFWARDEAHAIKIASDKRAVYLATKANG